MSSTVRRTDRPYVVEGDDDLVKDRYGSTLGVDSVWVSRTGTVHKSGDFLIGDVSITVIVDVLNY